MLVIREEQIQIMSEYLAKEFEERAYTHVQKCWPEQFGESGEESVRASISFAINKAGSYGITSEQGVIRYLNVMYMLGDDFDTNLKTPAISVILNDKFMPQRKKIDRLWVEAENAYDSTIINQMEQP